MKRALALALAAGLSVSVMAAAEPASAVGPPLSQYTIYGEGGVQIGVDSTILGLVGAKNEAANGFALRMNGGASIIKDPNTLINGDARVGGDVRMDNNTLIQNTLTRAVGTTLSKAASAVIGADVVADPELPTLPAPLPTPGGCPNNAADDGGANGQSRSPAPGIYGDWVFGANFTLNFNAPGNYTFNSLKAANGATFNVVPGVNLFVCGNATFGNLEVLPTTLKPAEFKVQILGTDPLNVLRMGGSSHWIGDVFAPFGGIHIGSGGSTASFVGHLHAGGVVDIEHGVNGSGPGGGTTPPDVGKKDATLSHGAKNENNGANLSLWVKAQIASVVGFDATQINLPVTKAILRVTVCHTPGDPTWCPDPSSQWPAGGGIVDAQRLEDGWERWGSGFPNPTNTPPEGNGNNFPIKNNPRGDGAGVTWNCAIDTDIADAAQGCSNANGNFWNAGLLHDGPLRPSTTLLTNNMPNGTVIEFDVTADVNVGLGPLDTTFMTWFIRKTPNTGSGEVFFYSNEGAAAAANPAFAPQLIITP